MARSDKDFGVLERYVDGKQGDMRHDYGMNDSDTDRVKQIHHELFETFHPAGSN